MTIKETARQAAKDALGDWRGDCPFAKRDQMADAVAVAALTAIVDRLKAQAERIQLDAAPDYRAGEAFALEYAALGIGDALAEFTPAPVTPEPECLACKLSAIGPDYGHGHTCQSEPVTPEPPRSCYVCTECQIVVPVDEDGCCRGCGHDATLFGPVEASEARPTTEDGLHRTIQLPADVSAKMLANEAAVLARRQADKLRAVADLFTDCKTLSLEALPTGLIAALRDGAEALVGSAIKNTSDLSPSPPPEVEPFEQTVRNEQFMERVVEGMPEFKRDGMTFRERQLGRALIAAVRAESSAKVRHLEACREGLVGHNRELRSALAAQAQEIERLKAVLEDRTFERNRAVERAAALELEPR